MRARVVVLALLTIGSMSIGVDAAVAGGGGCHEPPSATPEPTMTIVMKDFCIRPGVVQIQPGDTVEVVNRDSFLHNLYGPDWHEGDLQPGDSARRTFDKPGTYTFACTLHPGMTGAVMVGDTKLISATAPPANDDGGGGGSAGLVLGISLALLVCAAGGWAFGRVTRPHAPA